jgi:hypothetical protein
VDSAGHLSEDELRAQLDEARQEIERLAARLTARRPVADELLLFFGRVAGFVLALSAVWVLVLVVIRPETDISGLTKLLDTQLSIILGAVLGYAARTPERRQPP